MQPQEVNLDTFSRALVSNLPGPGCTGVRNTLRKQAQAFVEGNTIHATFEDAIRSSCAKIAFNPWGLAQVEAAIAETVGA